MGIRRGGRRHCARGTQAGSATRTPSAQARPVYVFACAHRVQRGEVPRCEQPASPHATWGSSAGGTCSRNKMRVPIFRRPGWAAFSRVERLSMPLCCHVGKHGFRVTAACGGEAGAVQGHGHRKRFRRRASAEANSEQDRRQATFARKSCVASGRSPTSFVEGEGERWPLKTKYTNMDCLQQRLRGHPPVRVLCGRVQGRIPVVR